MMEFLVAALFGLSFAAFLWRNRPQIDRCMEYVRQRARQEGKERLDRLVIKAGLPVESATQIRLTQYGLAVAGFLLGLFLAILGLPLFFPLLLGAIGFVGPRARLNMIIRQRQRSILLDLPYYLDLTTLALEAGLDLVSAIEEIARHDRPSPLREEFQMMLASIRMGTTRRQAFSDLAGRTGLKPLALLASSVTQSEELGTGLGNLFRLQSESLRGELYRQAEEEAQRAPIKLLIPLIGLIFPVVFLLLFAPLALRFFF